jgi:hypothetical protein
MTLWPMSGNERKRPGHRRTHINAQSHLHFGAMARGAANFSTRHLLESTRTEIEYPGSNAGSIRVPCIAIAVINGSSVQ